VRNVLATGGAGFIGSNFIHLLLREYGDIRIVNCDTLNYAGNLENHASIAADARYTFVKVDIREKTDMRKLFEDYAIDTVVNFAAESHVDRSIIEPLLFLDVNVRGTQTLLEVALESWRLGSSSSGKQRPDYAPGVRFLQVSTDEVYGTLTPEQPSFTESNALLPNSPYSASKASADHFVRAYHETYGLPVCITRCSNNYGPYQFPEKLIPLMLHNALHDRSLPVYGDGLQVRDWLYVEDHCRALCAVLERGKSGAVYNIGGNSERQNIQIVRLLLDILGKPYSLIKHVEDRLGHDRRYAINNSRICSEIGWTPMHTFEDGIAKTVQWYLDNAAWVDHVVSGDYVTYYKSMYGE
jgi:dTDP-glucose 4,6-dehydratase